MPSLFEVTAGKLTGPTKGGTVTQATNKGTGVTLNTESGQITMNNAALAGTAGSYLVAANTIAAGSFAITVSNVSAGSLSEAIVINFVALKGASS
jgi:hypothetical protein